MTYVILTCSEHFTDLALNELQRQHSNVSLVKQVSPQHLFIKAPISFDNLTRPWRTQLSIYLHHLFPVHQIFPLTGTAADFNCLRKQAQAQCRKDYLVQARVIGDYPFSAITLEQVIHPGQPASSITKAEGRVLSLLVVDRYAYMGISWVSQNLSAFATGRPYFDEPLPNRAGFKMLEALVAFNVHLRPGDHALDLGAAPGAWTVVLVRRGMHVTAVAPSPMYDWLYADPNVCAIQQTAEEYLPQCNDTYDLIVNDMKLDAQDSPRVMAQYAAHLRSQGIAIMTLKLRLRNTSRVMDHAFRLLRKEYKILRVRQLVSNRKEVTLFLRRHE